MAMMARLREFLETHHVPYELHRHKHAFTATAVAEADRVPKSEMAKAAFVQLAALCGGDSTAGRDGDCTVSVTSTSAGPAPSKGGQGSNNQVYQ